MALSNLFGWTKKNEEAVTSACGAACREQFQDVPVFRFTYFNYLFNDFKVRKRI